MSPSGAPPSAPTATAETHTGLWQWKDAPAYKNERLAYYQKQLTNRGVPAKDLQLLTAQLIQEAGSLSETTIGDSGCSLGILQYNACAHHGMKAKKFLAQPQWKDWSRWDYQLDRMADMVASRYELYGDDIKRIIVHHNGPVFAKRGTDTPAGYFRSITQRTHLLISL